MLKPTLRPVSSGGTIKGSANGTTHAIADGFFRRSAIKTAGSFLSLLLLGTLFFGCGEDTPPQDRKGLEGADSVSQTEPSDTIASTLPPGTTDSTVAIASASAGGSGAAAMTTSTGAKGTGGAISVSNTTTSGTGAGTTVSTMSTTTKPTTEPVGTGEGKPYDPATFDALLRANVSNGKVDYAAFKGNTEFAGFLQTIATTSPDGMSTNGKLAFWINAYNALVIKNVNDNPGIKQPLDVPGFFDKKKFAVAGKQLTLNQIENEVIRPTFKEPLIHFGLVCAARSCPPLIGKAYTEANVRSQLAANAEAYLGDTKQNRYDAGAKTLSLSKIFEWYKEDFGGNDAGLIDFAKNNGPDGMKSALASATGVKVKFNEYDWTLNKK